MLNDIFNKYYNGNFFEFNEIIEHKALNETFTIDLQENKSITLSLREAMGKQGEFSANVGTHPDFLDIEDNEVHHYIISMFVDIQGSTNLVFKYDLSRVRDIKNRILTAAIEIVQAFDGHVHRLQGDAIFGYFGGKKILIGDAIIDSLNASSVLQSFINEYLRTAFENEGIDPIKIRVGIDLGYDKDVLWSKYGIKECYEITTTSLHTDLAAKLQNSCSANNIMIGENLVNHMDIPEEFLSIKKVMRNGEQEEEKYIIKKSNFRYKMFIFNWEQYLKSFEIYLNNSILDEFNITCRYSKDESFSNTYISNSCALPTDMNLMFIISGLTSLENYDFKWIVENRGEEAEKSDNEMKFEMDTYRGKIKCHQTTAYHGHHYMHCKIFKDSKLLCKKSFGVFINNKDGI